MGFLKFLKRDKSKEMNLSFDNFDVPPMPPEPLDMGENYPESLPELPELPDFDDTVPRMEEAKKPVSDVSDSKISLQQNMRVNGAVLQQPEDFEPIESIKSNFEMQRPEEPMHGIREDITEMKPEPRRESPYERFSRAAVREERSVLEHKEAKGPVYMRMDKFRNILLNVSEIRSSLRASNEVLSKLTQMDANADKEFEKWKNIMADMQKKLVFVDKTLFNGGKG